jgi:hypothetical protein
VSVSATTFGPGGGTGTLTVAVARECAWAATSQAPWIAITSPHEGHGDGAVTYRVSDNPDPVSRRGGLVAAERTIELQQEPAACRFDVARPTETASADGGQTTIEVRAHHACRWTALSEDVWATVAPSSGQGHGVVRVTVAPNSGPSRTATVIVAGERLSLAQAARTAPAPPTPAPAPPPAPTPPAPAPPPSPCAFAVSPADQSFGPAGGTGTVRVTTGADCAWTAASSAPWVVITSSRTGGGSADVRYAVAPNPLTSSREANVTIVGSVHRVSQSGLTSGGGGERVELEGSVASLTGSCPNLRFSIRGTTVTTSSSTRFDDGKCTDIRNGRTVEVRGRRQDDGSVAADRVEIDD